MNIKITESNFDIKNQKYLKIFKLVLSHIIVVWKNSLF